MHTHTDTLLLALFLFLAFLTHCLLRVSRAFHYCDPWSWGALSSCDEMTLFSCFSPLSSKLFIADAPFLSITFLNSICSNLFSLSLPCVFCCLIFANFGYFTGVVIIYCTCTNFSQLLSTSVSLPPFFFLFWCFFTFCLLHRHVRTELACYLS